MFRRYFFVLICCALAKAEPRRVIVNLERPVQMRYRIDQQGSDWQNLATQKQGSQTLELPDQDLILQAWADSGFLRYSSERRLLGSAQFAEMTMSRGPSWPRILGLLGVLTALGLLAYRLKSRQHSKVLATLQSHLNEDEDAWIGRVIGDYRIDARLGQGGMATVYRAQRLVSDNSEPLALKVLPLEGTTALTVERFYRECKVASQLLHPNLVRVYDYGQRGQLLYLALEYVDGSTLRNTIPENGLPISEAVRWMTAMTEAMAYCHKRNIAHCDLKPENVMINLRGQLKILDFGLARDVHLAHLTPTHCVVGTPAYLAPERFDEPSARVRPSADQYALGVMFYEFLTGRPPYLAEDPSQYSSMHHSHSFGPLELVRPDTPGWLVELVHRMLSPQPEGRFPDLQAVLERLRQFSSVEDAETIHIARPY